MIFFEYEQIVKIHGILISKTGGMDGVRDELYTKEILIKQIQQNPNIKYFGAVENGKVVSTCYCVIIPNLTNFCQKICFVENVVTDKNYRNQGIGKKVIDKAIETAKKNNCYKVILLSGIARKEAHQFYENLGFSSETKKAFDMRE